MVVVFDASILLLYLDESAAPPKAPDSDTPVDRARARVEHLFEALDKSKATIVIPTPVLSEVMIHADEAGPEWLDKLSHSARFRIVSFDPRAAVEAALMTKDAMGRGDKRGGITDATWAKVKFDRQIVAIAKVEGAAVVYSDDTHIHKHLKDDSISVVRCHELPLPPEDPQGALDLPHAGGNGDSA